MVDRSSACHLSGSSTVCRAARSYKCTVRGKFLSVKHCQPQWVKPGLPPWGPHARFSQVQTLVRRAVRWSSCAILNSIVCWSNGLTVRSSTGPDDPIIHERDADLRCLVQSAAIVRRIGEGRGGGRNGLDQLNGSFTMGSQNRRPKT